MNIKSKSLLIFCILIFSCLSVSAQIDKEGIHRRVRSLSLYFGRDAAKLAHKICKPYSTEEEKVEALSYWVARRIKYDVKAFRKRKLSVLNTRQILKKRKALCGQYAFLFEQMCKAEGISCEMVSGYTKDYDFFSMDTLYRCDHAWNVVKVNGEWQLMDITWGAGYIKEHWLFHNYYFKRKYNAKWFYTEPQEMIKSHFPAMAMFQLLQNPVSIQYFRKYKKWNSDSLKVDRQASDLESFVVMDTIPKIYFLGRGTNIENPNNHMDLAMAYLDILRTGVNRYYNPNIKKVSCTKVEQQYYKSCAIKADSLFKLAAKDNDAEFEFYQARNASWKDTLKYNADLRLSEVRQLNTRISIQKSLNTRNHRQKKKMQRFLSRKSKAISETKLNAVSQKVFVVKDTLALKLALEDVRTQLKESAAYIDTIETYKLKLRIEIDSILSGFTSADVDSCLNREKINVDDLKQIAGSTRFTAHILPAFHPPLVHYTDEIIKTKKLALACGKSICVNKVNFDSMLVKQNSDLLYLFECFKQYRELVITSQKLCISMKKLPQYWECLPEGFTIEQAFRGERDDLSTNFRAYSGMLEKYDHNKYSVKHVIKRELKAIVKTKEAIRDLVGAELARERIYKSYRKLLCKYQNRNIKDLQKMRGKFAEYMK